MRTRTLPVALLLLAPPGIARAQSTLAIIVGVVRDQSALAPTGASITQQDLDQNTRQETVSDADGSFQFLNIKPGCFTFTVRVSGFSDFNVKEVQVAAGRRSALSRRFRSLDCGKR